MSYFSTIKLISDFLQVSDTPEFDFNPTYHQVAQSFCKWPIAVNENGIQIKLFEWGLIADYMNTPEKIKNYRTSMVNARSEKLLDDTKSIWHQLRHQRCLVFSTGFFEHQALAQKKKQPYFIKVKDETIFCMAGVYNYAPIPDKETGEMIGTFSILTMPANGLMKTIHNSGEHSERMPLILTHQQAHKWISEKLADEELVEICGYCFPETAMEAWPVDTIRKAKEDNEKIIQAITIPKIPELPFK